MDKTNTNSAHERKNTKRKPKKKVTLRDLRTKKTPQTIPINDHMYDRQKDLPRLIPLWPEDLKDDTEIGTKKIIEKIYIALQVERRKAKTSHWSYNLTKHIGLLVALKAEKKKHAKESQSNILR